MDVEKPEWSMQGCHRVLFIWNGMAALIDFNIHNTLENLKLSIWVYMDV